MPIAYPAGLAPGKWGSHVGIANDQFVYTRGVQVRQSGESFGLVSGGA